MPNLEEYSDDNIIKKIETADMIKLNKFAYDTAKLIDDIEDKVRLSIEPEAKQDLRYKASLHRRTLKLIQKRREGLSSKKWEN